MHQLKVHYTSPFLFDRLGDIFFENSPAEPKYIKTQYYSPVLTQLRGKIGQLKETWSCLGTVMVVMSENSNWMSRLLRMNCPLDQTDTSNEKDWAIQQCWSLFGWQIINSILSVVLFLLTMFMFSNSSLAASLLRWVSRSFCKETTRCINIF